MSKSINKPLELFLEDETSCLKTVILGHSRDMNPSKPVNNPKYAETIKEGREVTDLELMNEIEGFAELLEREGVRVIRPENTIGCTQIFPRDIGFVIADTFIVSNMRFENRKCEFSGIKKWVDQFPKVLYPPKGVIIEGGDVVLFGKYVFVGIGQRTNLEGVAFLEKNFKEKTIVPLQLQVTDDARTNILHLDCALQPVGQEAVIIYEDGFTKTPEAIFDLFSPKNRIMVSQQEMYEMVPNVFSVSPNRVVIEKKFERLAGELRKRDVRPLSIAYRGVSGLGGLLRCS
ncbi:MAG: amidinotransferase, partial [Saprospirales bacterium]